MEDAEDLAVTLERKTRIATARLTAITPITVDVPPPIPMEPLLPPWAPYVGAALGAICSLALTTGLALGHHPSAPAAAREGHAVVVIEANEEITYQALSAPDKALPLEDPPAPAPAPIRHRRKASGGFFGHLGSDRRR